MEVVLVVALALAVAGVAAWGCRALGTATARAVVSRLVADAAAGERPPPRPPSDRPYEDVGIPVPGGMAPAWLVEARGGGTAPTWAVHIHEERTTREAAREAVEATATLGMTSLVVSYRGDGEAPPPAGGRSALGQQEWEDVEAALTFAIERGARSLVLVGWSLGAAIALQLTERSAHRAFIDRLVLVRPVTDARALVRAELAERGLPPWLAPPALRALAHRADSARAGLGEPVAFDRLDWSHPGRLTVPALVIHTAQDGTDPPRSTLLFAMANPRLVRLVELPRAGRAGEARAPAGFDRAVVEFLEPAREDDLLG